MQSPERWWRGWRKNRKSRVPKLATRWHHQTRTAGFSFRITESLNPWLDTEWGALDRTMGETRFEHLTSSLSPGLCTTQVHRTNGIPKVNCREMLWNVCRSCTICNDLLKTCGIPNIFKVAYKIKSDIKVTISEKIGGK